MSAAWPIRRVARSFSDLMKEHGHPIAVEYDREYHEGEYGWEGYGLTLVPYCPGCNRNLGPPSRDVFVRDETLNNWPAEVLNPVIVELLANASDLSLCRCKRC